MKSRFRIFAGPNGSGKSSLFEFLRSTRNIHTEIYISADRIEAELGKRKRFVFNAYRISTSQDDFFNYIQQNSLWTGLEESDPGGIFMLKGGILKVKKEAVNSYTAALIAGYLVDKLMNTGQSFCFETVMSHESKLELFAKAKLRGYKTYLYFIFTRSIDLNIQRIKLRARTGGHDVPEEKVRKRFGRSMGLMGKAIENADMAFVIDNTYNEFTIIGSKQEGKITWLDKTLPDSIIINNG